MDNSINQSSCNKNVNVDRYNSPCDHLPLDKDYMVGGRYYSGVEYSNIGGQAEIISYPNCNIPSNTNNAVRNTTALTPSFNQEGSGFFSDDDSIDETSDLDDMIPVEDQFIDLRTRDEINLFMSELEGFDETRLFNHVNLDHLGDGFLGLCCFFLFKMGQYQSSNRERICDNLGQVKSRKLYNIIDKDLWVRKRQSIKQTGIPELEYKEDKRSPFQHLKRLIMGDISTCFSDNPNETTYLGGGSKHHIYDSIVNPATGRKVSVFGKSGQNIIQNYLKLLK